MNTVQENVVSSYLFGAIPASSERIILFEGGLLGFPSNRRWLLLDGACHGTAWLQSVDQEALAFMLVDPFVLFESFAVDLSSAELRRLGTTNSADLLVFALVTLPRNSNDEATANLQGPLVINVRARRGMQMIVEGGRWRVREPFAITTLSATSALSS